MKLLGSVRLWTLAGLLGCGMAIAAWAVAQEPTAAPAKASSSLPQPIVSTHDLMEIFNEPLYERLKTQLQQEPTNQRDWNRLKDLGYEAAEVTNLVAIRKRTDEHDQAWQQLTREGLHAALQLAEAAKGKDYPAAQKAYRAIIANCNQCHQQIEPEHAPQLEP